MSNELDPVVDQWYTHVDKGQSFYVTAIDVDSVEIQYFDGNVEEFNSSEWPRLDIELSEQPENWTGALDVDAPEQVDTMVTDTGKKDWTDPLQDFHRTELEQVKLAQEPDEPRDDYAEGYVDEEPLEDT